MHCVPHLRVQEIRKIHMLRAVGLHPLNSCLTRGCREHNIVAALLSSNIIFYFAQHVRDGSQAYTSLWKTPPAFIIPHLSSLSFPLEETLIIRNTYVYINQADSVFQRLYQERAEQQSWTKSQNSTSFTDMSGGPCSSL